MSVQNRQRRIKILQLCAVDVTVEAFLLPLINRLTAEGYDVQVLCSPGLRVKKLREKGYNIKTITILRKIRPISHFISLIRLYKYIKREKFDIVHTYTPIASIIGRLAAKLSNVPIIIYTSLGFYFHEQMILWKQKALILLERLAAQFTDFIFTLSIEDEKTAIEEAIIPKSKLMGLNGIGIDTHRFDPRKIPKKAIAKRRKELRIKNIEKVIGFIGRPVKEKGIIDLIKSFAKVKQKIHDIKLLIIRGSVTSERDTKTGIKMMALIKKLGLIKDIILIGFVEDVRELLAMIDIYVLPSYREGMPQSILEAMAMGKPVVATNIRGCREEIIDGVTGFLVPVKDPDALSEAIIKVLVNEELASKMGKEGRKRAKEIFDEKIVINKQIKVYRNLLQLKLREP